MESHLHKVLLHHLCLVCLIHILQIIYCSKTSLCIKTICSYQTLYIFQVQLLFLTDFPEAKDLQYSTLKYNTIILKFQNLLLPLGLYPLILTAL